MTTYFRATRRVARKRHWCDGCQRWIEPGEIYLEHVVPPWFDDLDNEHWWRLPECADCARRYGRAEAVAS